MLRIAIIIGCTRPARIGAAVRAWAYEIARKRHDADELLDLAPVDLPLLDEPKPAMSGQYTHDHTRTWSAAVASFDGYFFVTPEYNGGTSAALKNAIDFLYQEWINILAGLTGAQEISYEQGSWCLDV